MLNFIVIENDGQLSKSTIHGIYSYEQSRKTYTLKQGNYILLGDVKEKERIVLPGNSSLIIQGDVKQSAMIEAPQLESFVYIQHDLEKNVQVAVREGITCKGNVLHDVVINTVGADDACIHVNDIEESAKIMISNAVYVVKNKKVDDQRAHKKVEIPVIEPHQAISSFTQAGMNRVSLKNYLELKLYANLLIDNGSIDKNNIDMFLSTKITMDTYDFLPLFHFHRKRLSLEALKFLAIAIEFKKSKNWQEQINRLKALADAAVPFIPALIAYARAGVDEYTVTQNHEHLTESLKYLKKVEGHLDADALAKEIRDTFISKAPSSVSSPVQGASSNNNNASPVSQSSIGAVNVPMEQENLPGWDKIETLEQYLQPKLDACYKKGTHTNSEAMFMLAAKDWLNNFDRPMQLNRFKIASEHKPAFIGAIIAYAMARCESYINTRSSVDLREALLYFGKAFDRSPFARHKYEELILNVTNVSHSVVAPVNADSKKSSLTLPEFNASDFIKDEADKPSQGSSALVYKVRDKKFESQCYATKEFNDGVTEAFIMKEAERMLKVQHPNIVRIYGSLLAMSSGKLCGFVMEFMAGGTLFDMLHDKTNPPVLSILDRLKMGIELSSALAWLHANEVLHCDMKSPNVLRDQDGTLKVGDFGISKDLDKHRTTTQAANMSLLWAAPEICNGGKHTKKSDAYALAIVLWEIDNLKIPFDELSLGALVMKKVDKNNLPLALKKDSLFNNVIENGLAFDPDKRSDANEYVVQFSKTRDDELKKIQSQSRFQTTGKFM